jgi:hypothetical protein
MKHTALLFIIIILLILTACAPGTTPVPVPAASTPVPQPASAIIGIDSTSEQIREAMRTSALNWKTVYMDGIVTWYSTDGTSPSQRFHEQVWIDQLSSRYRVLLSGSNSESPETFKASDGTTILEMNVPSGTSQNAPLPDFVKTGQYVPPIKEGVAYPNPLWGQMGTPLSQLAFSSDSAQNRGTFKPVNMDVVETRKALVVEWTYIENQLPSFRAWLDTETAVILRMQEFGKAGGTTVTSERYVTQIIYNAAFDAGLFGAPSVPPQFSDITAGVMNTATTDSAPPPADEALGELYFFTLPHQAGQSAQLVRLPGSCAVGLTECPAVESIPVPFPFNFNLTALSWSPDGSLAAFAYSDNVNGTPTKLWFYEPTANAWTSFAEFAFIDPPFWSPDGTWVAFRVQDGLGGENVYAIRRDGRELKNLTESGNLPVEGRPYIMDGWITENIIVRSALPGSTGSVYLIRVSDGFVRPMFETLLTKATFTTSPDNAWFVYDDYDYNSQKHAIKVIEPDGANPVELAAFAGGNVYPIIWSPDSSRVAFAHSSSDTNFNPVADVYVVGRDGHGMTQVYKGNTVGRILFSPSGKYLLIEETTSPTGGHLFVINLETLEQKIIIAPGLTLDTDWYAPSWRP